ncbi:P-loop NTPase family protein [Robertmurraya massiliosenegalensis]|uniref:hypothetical protein n=1 Tax=Robertmurraya massiliosenegalensis TaxID=1287657 RepID=UPI0002EF08C1|nr:hypothetical protein [Robertmurraya massiliosenegalensis]
MKLQVLSADEILISKIKEKNLFEQVVTIHSLDKVTEDYLLISDTLLSYDELSNLDLQKTKKTFYMLQNHYEPNLERIVKAFCESRDIVLVPSRLVADQIIEVIEKTINPLKYNSSNVFCFLSSIGNVGTTTTCLSVAKHLASHSKDKIGVLLLNAWDDGTDQLDYRGSYLHEIKTRLASQLLSNQDEFLSLFHMVEKDSLYVLGGNKNTRMERLFKKEEVNYLIELSKEYFDIVLIDCGCHFDNALMVQSLTESDLRFLIVNQQNKAIKKFNQFYDDVLYPIGYKKSDFLMVINNYHDDFGLMNSKEINKEIGVPMLTTIEESNYGRIAEKEQTLLYNYEMNEYSTYQDSINIIAKSISSATGIELTQPNGKKKKRLFSRG